ncbi:MAG: hypothetical protein ACK4KT_08535 [Thermaurantimonas sp.]
MKKIGLLVIAMLLNQPLKSQLYDISTLDTVLWVEDAAIRSFTTDNLGNIYLIYDQEIQKIVPYPQANTLKISFSEPNLGRVASIDPFNPMRILVRYQPFNHILFLDNKLNKIQQSLMLEELGLMDVQLASMTTQNRIWLYDQVLDQVLLYNPRIEGIEFSTQNITQLLGTENTPQYMQSDASGLYLYIPDVGLMIFDVFGNYIKLLPVRNLSSVQIRDKKLYGMEGKNILISGLNVNYLRRIELPYKDPIRQVRFENQFIFILFEGKGLLVALFPA